MTGSISNYFFQNKVLFLLCVISFTSCGSSRTGGPCDYETVNVLVYQIENDSMNGEMTVSLTPHQENDKKIWEKKLYVELDLITLSVNDSTSIFDATQIIGQITVMTKGTCSPYPSSIKIKDEYFNIID